MSHADQFKSLTEFIEKNWPHSQVQWGEPQLPRLSDHNSILLDETSHFRRQILMQERMALALRFPASPRPVPRLSRRRRLWNWTRRLPFRLIHQ